MNQQGQWNSAGQPLIPYEPIQSDEAIAAKISELKQKRNSGTKLTDKEIIELARLIRTLASRKYRQRQSSGKKLGTIAMKTSSDTKQDPRTVEQLQERIDELQRALSEALERENACIKREE